MKNRSPVILTLTVLVVLAMLAVREPAGDELPALLLAPSLTAASTVASTLTTPAPTAITPMPSQTPVLAVVTAHGLRIRACASHTCRTAGWLRYGDQVQVRSCQSGWAYLPGRGWSRSIYLEPDICNNK